MTWYTTKEDKGFGLFLNTAGLWSRRCYLLPPPPLVTLVSTSANYCQSSSLFIWYDPFNFWVKPVSCFLPTFILKIKIQICNPWSLKFFITLLTRPSPLWYLIEPIHAWYALARHFTKTLCSDIGGRSEHELFYHPSQNQAARRNLRDKKEKSRRKSLPSETKIQ